MGPIVRNEPLFRGEMSVVVGSVGWKLYEIAFIHFVRNSIVRPFQPSVEVISGWTSRNLFSLQNYTIDVGSVPYNVLPEHQLASLGDFWDCCNQALRNTGEHSYDKLQFILFSNPSSQLWEDEVMLMLLKAFNPWCMLPNLNTSTISVCRRSRTCTLPHNQFSDRR